MTGAATARPTTPSVNARNSTPNTIASSVNGSATVLWPGRALSCAPCYNGFEFAACGNNVCMQMIDVETVLECARRVLEVPREAAVA